MRYYVNRTNWASRCMPHLDNPELRRVLHRDFGLFVIGHYGTLKGDRMPGDFENWGKQRRPPWWRYVKDLACHYLINFNLRLAMLVEPQRSWRILTSQIHSTVWDGDKNIFDLNSTGGKLTADRTFKHARGELGLMQSWHDELPPGEHMPLGIFFPSRDESEWAQWENGIKTTPALRRAILKGVRRGHLDHLVKKSNYARAAKILCARGTEMSANRSGSIEKKVDLIVNDCCAGPRNESGADRRS
jgi:hypothetical protein